MELVSFELGEMFKENWNKRGDVLCSFLRSALYMCQLDSKIYFVDYTQQVPHSRHTTGQLLQAGL